MVVCYPPPFGRMAEKNTKKIDLGMKASGYGRFGAIGLDEWVRTKTVTFVD
jgi:hypothetical protein